MVDTSRRELTCADAKIIPIKPNPNTHEHHT